MGREPEFHRVIVTGVDGRGQEQGWVVISMKHDWKRIFAFE
jgi:hypothetical protein